jgi:peptide/nickel transport system substrate-binding protein
MRRPMRALALGVALGLVATACTGPEETASPAEAPEAPEGGTLRVAVPEFPASVLSLGEVNALDPHTDYWSDSFELHRCCLLRTLLSHNGRPTEEGGAQLRPDLALGLPDVSPDGLSWTFRLKEGLRYAPPLEDTEILAADVIRAVERVGRVPSGLSPYYSVIEGFDQMVVGKAESISGLEAPDDRTLVVHLTRPSGDLGHLFTLPLTAPLPPRPGDPGAPLGAATGHDDGYGRFLVASGPYMVEGAQDLDPGAPSDQQRPVSGYVPARSLTLVRNPSWDPATDQLRPARVDRIEVEIGGTLDEAASRIDAGEIDLMLYSAPAPLQPLDMAEAVRGDPQREDQVKVGSQDAVRSIPMNLAVPPLNDIHVRRAISYAVDKEALRELLGGQLAGDIAGHFAPNSLENNLLLAYDPYATPGHRGDPEAAREEMARSTYDSDGDGSCDHPACDRVLTLVWELPPFPELARVVRHNLRTIGIDLHLEELDFNTLLARMEDPRKHIPMAIGLAWYKIFLNASDFFAPSFSGTVLDDPANGNLSLVGASPEQLRRWGYSVTSVPSVDEKIESCLALVGDAQVRCWAETDQLLMEEVVPWVPYMYENQIQVVSARVVRYSFDQFASMPALDQVAVSG